MQQTVPQLRLSSENGHFDGAEPPKPDLEAKIHQIQIQKMYFFRKNHQKNIFYLFSKIVPNMIVLGHPRWSEISYKARKPSQNHSGSGGSGPNGSRKKSKN